MNFTTCSWPTLPFITVFRHIGPHCLDRSCASKITSCHLAGDNALGRHFGFCLPFGTIVSVAKNAEPAKNLMQSALRKNR